MRHHAERVEPEGQHLARTGPVALVAGVPAVGRVHGDEDVGVDHRLPERVELGEAERPRAAVTRHRGRADEDRLGAALDHPLELLDRLLHDRERDHRRGEDAVLVVERSTPRTSTRSGRGWRRASSSGSSRMRSSSRLASVGNISARSTPELVHQLEARSRLAEARACARIGSPMISRYDLPSGLPLRKYSSWAPGPGHDLEGRVRDVVADRAPDHDLRPAVQFDVVDGALVAVRQVPGERLLRLVHVVVGVEDGKVERSWPWLQPIAILTATSISELNRQPPWFRLASACPSARRRRRSETREPRTRSADRALLPTVA